MRATFGLIAFVLLVLGFAIQVGSWGLFGDRASAAAFPHLIPYRAGVTMDLALAHIPGLGGLRANVANAALAHQDLDMAEALAGSLSGKSRLELNAALDDRHGDHALALREYLAAGDGARIEDEVIRLNATNDPRSVLDARALQRSLIAQLGEIKPRPEEYAEALWRLGVVDSTLAYVIPLKRSVYAQDALADFRAAIAERPLAARYVLNAGNAAARIGDDADAQRYFTRVIELDPHSPPGFAALGMAALHRHDVAAARKALANGERYGPEDSDVARLRAAVEQAR